MVLSGATKKSPVTPPGIDPETVRLLAQCLNHYATPGPIVDSSENINLKMLRYFSGMRDWDLLVCGIACMGTRYLQHNCIEN
jgi:hypothetical protein